MIRTVRVTNFKSIPDLTLELGRVTVLIGANGSGKSNILEAIAFLAGAAAQDKLELQFLTPRGIRVGWPKFMLSAFKGFESWPDSFKVSATGDNSIDLRFSFGVDQRNTIPVWQAKLFPNPDDHRKIHETLQTDDYQVFKKAWDDVIAARSGPLRYFHVYSPENSALRTFQGETQVLPLGIRGEGLFAHLKALSSEKYKDRLAEIKDRLKLIDWYETFNIPDDLSPGERSIRIQDRFLPETALFDQRSANEGFLFLLFYVTLLVSPDTPAFFAIDNIDSSLNPKLCVALLQQIVELAKKYDKQVILTTHNPAVLDGLDLKDDEQRLLVVERNKDGHTKVRRVEAPKPTPGHAPVALSEAFLRGYIGGLPQSF